MSKTTLLLTMTKLEKQALQEIATKFGCNLSEYMRRKLFNENSDLSYENNRYLSIHSDKHNILSISILYKLIFLQRELIERQGYTEDQIAELDQKALEYSCKQREGHGYKIIEKNHA